MDNNKIINKLSKHLFWDVNRKTLNIDKNKAYIIKQVLEYGLIEDWRLIYRYYGISLIVEEVKHFRELDKKALSFITVVSKTPIEEFRCYNYQLSTPQHWNF
jgi:hypothetical protein